ncbi:MAG: hypothetical protein RL088_1985, partial [Verrucomicrobiota bacterium]
MSHHIAIPNSEKFDSKKAASLKTIFQLMAVIGLIGAGIVGFASPKLFAFSWLFAFFFGFTICLGCFFWNCLHHATDSEWSVVIRRQMENVSALLKVVAVLFIPIAAILVVKPDLLYSWIKPHLEDSLMQGTKGKYLNISFFWVRAIGIFGLLFLLSTVLRNRSIAQDADGAAKHTFTMRKAAIAGIPVMALSVTFGGIDWLKSLNHHWYST